MKALTWHGKGDIRCDTVPDPKIEDSRDAIIKVTACAICGSDLHIFDGVIPAMQSGDVLGHETMGEVVEVGADNKALKVGDRVVVPFTISCGQCFFCQRGFYSGCERSNPNAKMAEKLWGHSPAGLFGYSHLLGGFRRRPGGIFARSVRRCGSDQGSTGPQRRAGAVPVRHFSDRLHGGGFLQSERRRNRRDLGLRAGRTIRDPQRFPARRRRVIAIDTVPERLALAQSAGAVTLDFRKEDIYDRIQEMTAGRGADACIDAVGTEPDTMSGFDAVIDRVKVATFMGTDRPHVLRQAIHCCRNFGTVSIVGVYGGFVDKIPMGSAINRGLTFRMAQTPVQHYLPQTTAAHRKGRDRSILRHHAPRVA